MNKILSWQNAVKALLGFVISVYSCNVCSAEQENRYKIENQFVKFGLSARTPEQMAAFYEARGFPKQAIEAATQHCFITVGIRNISKHKIWLDLNRWRIFNEQGAVARTNREQWKQKWQQLNVPLASQATFNWTLLPESRDLHPDEPVGGNITLTPTDMPFTVEAVFATGDDQQGQPFVVKIENVRCLKDGEIKS
ncbi:MAG: hypothetical protein L0Z73_13235 [Gammaproteobacteria bacterium]|nr:hypothetical protein [Gammaproteobacteria bacterium]